MTNDTSDTGAVHLQSSSRTTASAAIHEQDELHVLLDVTSALSSSSDLNRILSVILTGATASQGLGFNRTFLFLYSDNTHELRGYAAVGPTSAEEAGKIWSNLDSLRLSLAELLDSPEPDHYLHYNDLALRIRDMRIDLNPSSAIRRACDQGTAVNFEQCEIVDSVTRHLADILGTQRFAIAPMLSKERLTGLLVADNLITNNAISERASRLLHILANHAAVAIERARLYDEQLARAEELELNNTLLAESQDQIIRIEKMSIMGQLISSLVHELRNPLTIVGGFANLMLHSSVSDEQKEYLGIIAGETRRTETVLDQILEFCQSSQSDGVNCNISEVLSDTVLSLQHKLRDAQVQVTSGSAVDILPFRAGKSQLIYALYHICRLIIDEAMNSGKLELHADRFANDAVVSIRLTPGSSDDADTVARMLRQLFGNGNSTLRLPMLVALETIRFYKGEYRLVAGKSTLPIVQIILPLDITGPAEATHG
ncbi:MAG: HAMP domain-containing sensor histidine kinase [Candidatus Zixiibacteriota bacterium]